MPWSSQVSKSVMPQARNGAVFSTKWRLWTIFFLKIAVFSHFSAYFANNSSTTAILCYFFDDFVHNRIKKYKPSPEGGGNLP